MRVLVDSLCCGNQVYGVGRLLLEHLKRLAGPGYPHVEVHLIVSRDNRHLYDIPNVRQILFPYSLRRRGLSFPLQILWERLALPRLVRDLSIDVFLRPNLAWYHPLPCPQAVFIHDLAEFHPLGMLQYSRARRIYRRSAAARGAARAARVLTISHHAAKEIRERFPSASDRIGVVMPGAPEGERRERPGAEAGSCFLSVGKQLLHKNQITLCRAYVEADRQAPLAHPLVFLGGEGNATPGLKEYVARNGYSDRILFKGFVPEEEKDRLYRNALAVLFPSFYEGFGLPILESMAAGVPLICSDSACLPEVAGKAALLIDPHAVGDWARAMADIDAGRVDLQGMSKAGFANLDRFSWEASTLKLARILESLSSAPSRRSPTGNSIGEAGHPAQPFQEEDR